MNSNQYCLIVSSASLPDPRAAALLEDVQALGLCNLTALDCEDLYFLEGKLGESDLSRLSAELLSDPVSQRSRWRSGSIHQIRRDREQVIEVALRPGVADPVAAQIVRCAHELGVFGVEQAATGRRFVLKGERRLTEHELDVLARRLLANPVVQRYALGEIEPLFPRASLGSGAVQVIALRECTPDQLLAISSQRRAALDVAEMTAIRDYFAGEGRDPTDVEFETLAQTWSEHCIHKTFKAEITLEDGPSTSNALPENRKIDGLLDTYIRAATNSIAAPWVRSAFADNAGIIDFDDEFEVSFKVETHNHPSAIEPFGGANTGVGGVIRDVLGVSATPIAATDVLCFGPQDLPPAHLTPGVLHPRRVFSGVVAGVQDYGNKIGLATVNGAILYDEGYTANPLVFCGCVGIAPKGLHPRRALSGDRVIVLGGRTGRDGLRGATFSSMAMDADTGEVASASVQIGDPIVEKGLIEVISRARDMQLYHAITDCGAGGLSSAVGEMASELGADIELSHVRLKYEGLAPWEIWLSEAQERMVLASPDQSIDALRRLCDLFDVEMTDIGVLNNTGRLVVRYDDRVVLDLANDFLFHGMPRRSLHAVLPPPIERGGSQTDTEHNLGAQLLNLLSNPNVRSKADVIRRYDHEIQGATVVKPLTGIMNDGPSDACVLKPIGTRGLRGIVLSNGVNPELGKSDAYRMAVSVVDEAVRNAVAVGADPDRIALLDNFCWGDPRNPETLGALVDAARGCHDAALHYRTPFISGKDSLNNEYVGEDGKRHSIPPTLLISAIGLIEDVTRAVTSDLKQPGDVVYLLGESAALLRSAEEVPGLPAHAPELYRTLHGAIKEGLVKACHDLSEGGLGVAAAEMCIGGRLGMALELDPTVDSAAIFRETNGCLLVEVGQDEVDAFGSQFEGPWATLVKRVGTVVRDQRFSIMMGREIRVSLSIDELIRAWDPETEEHVSA